MRENEISGGQTVQIDVPSPFVAALLEIVGVLGPEPAGCGCCQGCSAEMSEALRIAREALAGAPS